MEDILYELSFYGLAYIDKVSLETAHRLLIKRIEAREKEQMFKLYASVYPFFNEKNFMSFQEFTAETLKSPDALTPEPLRNRQEIKAEIKSTKKRLEK